MTIAQFQELQIARMGELRARATGEIMLQWISLGVAVFAFTVSLVILGLVWRRR